MVSLRPGPKQGPPKIPHLYVDLVPESTWLSLGPFVSCSRLATRKDSFLFHDHTFIIYISVDLVVFFVLTVVDTIQGACGTPFFSKKNFNSFQVMKNGFGWVRTLLNSLILG